MVSSDPIATRRLERTGSQQLILWAALGGAGFDLAVRAGVDGLAGTLLLAVMAIAVGRARPARPETVALAASAALCGMWLSMRTSPWLITLDVVAAAVLLLCAAYSAGGRSTFDLDLRAVLAGIGDTVSAALGAPATVRSAVNAREGPGRSIARGLFLAAPLAVVVGTLLASADAVFASFFGSLLVPSQLLLHAVLIVVGGWGAAGLLHLATASPSQPPEVAAPQPGRVESLVVVVALDLILGLFAIAQAQAASEGGRRVIETAGLNYAQYARSGFFQLLAVTAVVLVALALLRSVTDRSRSFALLAVVAVALTLVVGVVAARRLVLYTDAFGLTTSRLVAAAALAWIGLCLVLVAVRTVGPSASQSWLPAAMATAGLVVLMAFNALNPEAVVARTNLARAADGRTLDAEHILQLSDDAVPTIVARMAALDEADRSSLLESARTSVLCGQRRNSWAAFNRATLRADADRPALCEPGFARGHPPARAMD